MSPIRMLKDIIPGIRNHHETWDGTGYPDRLKGDQIPMVARIIGVADTFDAMTTTRPYQTGNDPRLRARENALDVRARGSTRLVIDAFLAAVEGGGHQPAGAGNRRSPLPRRSHETSSPPSSRSRASPSSSPVQLQFRSPATSASEPRSAIDIRRQRSAPLLDLMRQGSVLCSRAATNDALEPFQQADRIAPGNATNYNMIGLCYLSLDQTSARRLTFVRRGAAVGPRFHRRPQQPRRDLPLHGSVPHGGGGLRRGPRPTPPIPTGTGLLQPRPSPICSGTVRRRRREFPQIHRPARTRCSTAT